MSRKDKKPVLLCASFNQDQESFAVGHEHGYRIYNTDPMNLRIRRHFSEGGIGLIQMLYMTNYLVLVGGGRNPKFPENKVIVWDDHKMKQALALEFLTPVLNVLLSRTRLVVVLKSKIHVYSFSSPIVKLATYDTCDNIHGLAVLSTQSPPQKSSDGSEVSKAQILAFPARTEGQIQLVDISPAGQERNLISILKAHKSPVRCLALNRSGSLLATASETGTIIRVYSTKSTAQLYEFRRGLDKATIFSMAFSPSGDRLAVVSDKATLHVFNVSLGRLNDEYVGINRTHVLSKLPFLPRYFSSTWSFCSIRVDEVAAAQELQAGEGRLPSQGVLAWSREDSVILIWVAEGKWEKYVIVEKQQQRSKGPPSNSSREAINSVSPTHTRTPSVNSTDSGEQETQWELVNSVLSYEVGFTETASYMALKICSLCSLYMDLDEYKLLKVSQECFVRMRDLMEVEWVNRRVKENSQ